jgi:hypothetical protein
MSLRAPFPWFGGKSSIAAEIWSRFGNVQNYVEPFFGSGAVLLARPRPFSGVETINDACGFVANFWRAIQAAPHEAAAWADWPVSEADLEARHYWLVTEGRAILEAGLADPEWYDAKIAGWWCWGLCSWIGSGWCSGMGPWQAGPNGFERIGDAGQGINRKLPHIGSAGRGINRKLPHMSARQGINRQLPHMSARQGINRQLPAESPAQEAIAHQFQMLSDRLRRVRIARGDWSRVCGDSVTWRHGRTAIFLDPPYADTADRTENIYATDSLTVAHDVREWAIEAGKRPDMLICLAGYDGEHTMPCDWLAHSWKSKGGYGSQGHGRGRDNAKREMLWFSPACAPALQEVLI